MPRERTKSTREEFNVSSYVDSCIGFQGNLTIEAFASAPPALSDASRLTLLLVPEGSKIQTQRPAWWNEAVDAAVSRASEGAPYGFDINGSRVCIGIIPTGTVTRYNCVVRPDAITPVVTACCGMKGFSSLDIISCVADPAHAQAISAAVAKGAKRSFSAKGGRAEKAYYEPSIPMRLFVAAASAAAIVNLKYVADSVQLCMRLVDAPTNLLDTTTYVEIVQAYGQALGFDVSVIRGEELREKGYGGVYGVGKAAEFPPAIVTMTYKPKGAGISPKDKIAFVGKGIVYDTGGLSIKTPGTGMCGMKMDMGGSAAVFTGFLALVKAKSPYHIDCVLCLADNAIGPRAFRNDDILIMKSGRTVEVNNTDAEGRLVLGDGVFHAATETGKEPSIILDMATLTGAQGIATGKYHSGLFTNNADWEDKVMEHGRLTGDLCFPLLFCPEFHMPEFSSKVADVRNSVRNRSNAQSSCAAAFIHDNLPKTFAGAYVHLDIASPACRDEAATGYGPALLFSLFSA